MLFRSLLLVGLLTPALAAQTPLPAADARVVTLVRDSVPEFMRRMAIPGAVVTVVRGDRVLLNEGFGVADVARGIPVSPRTVFRTASVTKAFTAMAALRLASQGRLALDADIAQWVPEVDVGATASEPVTVAQLLTHTSGIDDYLTGYANSPGEAPPPLGELLPRTMPPRSRDPENAPSYSNYGYALVGLVVERISGMPFDRFLTDSVLAPLGLRDTRFMFRPSTDSAHALEYTSNGDLRVQRSTAPYPAGNLATSGDDMTLFLRTVLNAPSDDPMRRMLFTPALAYHPEMPPMGYALAMTRMEGHDVWMKGGAGPSHSAVLAFVPDANLGIFIAVNRQEPTLWNRLLPRLMASLDTVPGGGTVPAAARAAVDGDYLWTRAPLSSFERILGLGAQVRVRRLGVDSVLVDGPFIGGSYTRDGALRFRRADASVLAFRLDDDGTATRAFTIQDGQPITFERIPLHRTTRFQLGVLACGSALGLAAALVTIRRHPQAEQQPAWARISVMALPVVQLATVGASVLLASQGDRLLEGPTSGLYATMTLTTATAVAALVQAAGSGLLAGKAQSGIVRTTYGLSAVGGIGLTWFLGANNLIGFQF